MPVNTSPDYWCPKRVYSAASWVAAYCRGHGYSRINKAKEWAAEKYDVTEEEIQAELTRRNVLSRAHKPKPKTKFRYFIVTRAVSSDAEDPSYSEPFVVKAKTAKNATRRFSWGDRMETMLNDTGSSYSSCFSHHLVCSDNGYATKADAVAALPEAESRIRKANRSGIGLGLLDSEHDPKTGRCYAFE